MAKLEYDESGVTFSYFLVFLYGLFLLVATYFLWPRSKKGVLDGKLICQCSPCFRKKIKLDAQQPRKRLKLFARIVVLVILWAVFFFIVYWTFTQATEIEQWDPYEILGLSEGATTAEIRKKYRKLSMMYHPDKETGDQERFMMIAKAYEALTDEVSRENWEKYGNPDGPRAASFGIALPSWIVDKQNSLWVLIVYASVFIIGLPVVIGTWWYRSVKFSATNVLIDTTRLFGHFLSRARIIPVKRMIMILTSAMEFSKSSYVGIQDRPSDNIYLNNLAKQLPQVNTKTKEAPFCTPYATKCRLLLHAYLEQVDIPEEGLMNDQEAIVKHCLLLLGEMINLLSQLWEYSHYYKNQKNMKRKLTEPSLETFENVMRLSQMLVQAKWGNTPPLLQLPHLTQEHLRHFITKRRRIGTIEEFVSVGQEGRRRLVRSLSDEEYRNTLAFCSGFPHICMKVVTEVADDEDKSLISAGSIVTVQVFLERKNLLEYHNISIDELLQSYSSSSYTASQEDQDELKPEPAEEKEEDGTEEGGSPRNKQHPQSGGRSRGKKQQQQKKKKKIMKKAQAAKAAAAAKRPGKDKGSKTSPQVDKEESKGEDLDNDSEEDSNESDKDVGAEDERWDEDKEWSQIQASIKEERKKKEAGMKRESYPTHSPFFPAEKHEMWWIYLADRKRNTIVRPPEKVVGLVNSKEVSLQLPAPAIKGQYRYTVVLASDSYLGLNIQQEIKLNVQEKKEVSGKEQWRELEDEEEEADVLEETSEEESESEDATE